MSDSKALAKREWERLRSRLADTERERDRLREAIDEHIQWHGSIGHEGLWAALATPQEETE